jgi:uncharacterized Fe-S center protein
MKQTVDNASQFRDAFRAMDRHTQFSYEGMELLFNHLEECDSEMELDVIAICCDYSEDSPEQIIESYGIEYDTDEPEASEAATAYLEANTVIIGTTSTGSIVYASNF